MNKKLIIFLSFLFSLVILLTLTFYFLQRNKVNNNNSQEAFIQEENNEEKENEELNNKEKNEENLNNSQEKEEIKDEEIEEPMKISNYFSILIIVVLVFFSIEIYISLIKNKNEIKAWDIDFHNFFLLFFSNFFQMSRIDFFLPSEIISYIYRFSEILKNKKYNIKELAKKLSENKQKIMEILEKHYESHKLRFFLFNLLFAFPFEILFFLFLFFLTSLPFLVITNGLKNFKKRFRWKYLVTSPFLFFRQGNILMKITLILQFFFILFDFYLYILKETVIDNLFHYFIFNKSFVKKEIDDLKKNKKFLLLNLLLKLIKQQK